MAKIKITVNVDGNEVTREYIYTDNMEYQDWDERINDMISTLENSKDVKEF